MEQRATPPLDAYDRRILQLLQRDNRISRKQIGEAVHLSAAAVHRRITAMEASGVIRSHVAVVDPARVGQPVTAIVDVTIEREQLPLLDELKRHFRSAAEVQQCYYVTGEADFVLVIQAASLRDYEDVTRRLFFSQKNIRNFRTRMVMDEVKVGLEVLVREPA